VVGAVDMQATKRSSRLAAKTVNYPKRDEGGDQDASTETMPSNASGASNSKTCVSKGEAPPRSKESQSKQTDAVAAADTPRQASAIPPDIEVVTVADPGTKDGRNVVKMEQVQKVMSSSDPPKWGDNGISKLGDAVLKSISWALDGHKKGGGSGSYKQWLRDNGGETLWDATVVATRLEAFRLALEKSTKPKPSPQPPSSYSAPSGGAVSSASAAPATRPVPRLSQPSPKLKLEPSPPKPPKLKPEPSVRPQKKMAVYRLNFACKPLGRSETEKSGPTTMSTSRKQELCRRGIEALGAGVAACLSDWRAAGSPVDAPPRVSNLAAGSEKGDHRGKLHLQPVLEFWDVEGLGDKALKSHVAQWLHAQLDPLMLDEDGEHWYVGGKNKTDKPVRAVGGWMYDLAYTHKDSGHDWCFTCRCGVDAAEALALKIFHVETIWPACVALFGAHDMQAKVRCVDP
jgi:hypothetical protein